VTISESNEKCMFKSSKDLKITDVKNACSSALSEQHITLENDNLSILNNQTSNFRNAELTIHNEENLKKTVSDSIEIITTNTCELNKLDNVDSSSSSSVNSTNVKICNGEKLSTTVIVSNSNDNNLKDKIIGKHIKNDNYSLKCSYELNNGPDYMDLDKSGNSNDSSSHKDTVIHERKNKNPEPIIESKNASNIPKITEKMTNTSLIQNQNNSSNVKVITEITNEDSDTNNKSANETVNNPFLQTILLTLSDVSDSNNENGTKNIDISRRKRIKKTIDTVQDLVGEDKQGRKYLTSKAECGISSISVIKN